MSLEFLNDNCHWMKYRAAFFFLILTHFLYVKWWQLCHWHNWSQFYAFWKNHHK